MEEERAAFRWGGEEEEEEARCLRPSTWRGAGAVEVVVEEESSVEIRFGMDSWGIEAAIAEALDWFGAEKTVLEGSRGFVVVDGSSAALGRERGSWSASRFTCRDS